MLLDEVVVHNIAYPVWLVLQDHLMNMIFAQRFRHVVIQPRGQDALVVTGHCMSRQGNDRDMTPCFDLNPADFGSGLFAVHLRHGISMKIKSGSNS